MGGFEVFFLAFEGLIYCWVFGFGGRGLRGEVFVGSGVCSFSFVLCTLGFYFGTISSRGEGVVTVVFRKSFPVVSGFCSFLFGF